MNAIDASRLQDMLEAACTVQEFAAGKTRASLNTDRQLEFALRTAIVIIGEAASKITQETRQQYPQINWREIIGTRNVLIHAYMRIDDDRIWQVVTEDIPPLISELEKIIPPETDEPENT